MKYSSVLLPFDQVRYPSLPALAGNTPRAGAAPALAAFAAEPVHPEMAKPYHRPELPVMARTFVQVTVRGAVATLLGFALAGCTELSNPEVIANTEAMPRDTGSATIAAVF
jgi:hypothetical protein